MNERDISLIGIIIVEGYSGIVVGKYTNGFDAVQAQCNVLIYDIVDKSYIPNKYFAGSDPPKYISSRGNNKESKIDDYEILDYILNVIKHNKGN